MGQQSQILKSRCHTKRKTLLLVWQLRTLGTFSHEATHGGWYTHIPGLILFPYATYNPRHGKSCLKTMAVVVLEVISSIFNIEAQVVINFPILRLAPVLLLVRQHKDFQAEFGMMLAAHRDNSKSFKCFQVLVIICDSYVWCKIVLIDSCDKSLFL